MKIKGRYELAKQAQAKKAKLNKEGKPAYVGYDTKNKGRKYVVYSV